MGCGQKAVAEDEDDWDNLKSRVDLQDVPWKVYSREAAAVRELHQRLKSTGLLLKLDVLQFIAQQDLREAHRREREEFVKAEQLMKKYT